MTSYSSSLVTKVTLVLSCRVSEILERSYAKNHFFLHPTSIRAKISGCSPWSRPVMLGSAESEHPRLTNREIIFEEFQPRPMWSQSTNVTDTRTDRQTTCDCKTGLCTLEVGRYRYFTSVSVFVFFVGFYKSRLGIRYRFLKISDIGSVFRLSNQFL